MKKLANYITDSIAELKKVVWPTKKQATTYSIIVIALTIGTAILFAVLDYFFSWLLGLII